METGSVGRVAFKKLDVKCLILAWEQQEKERRRGEGELKVPDCKRKGRRRSQEFTNLYGKFESKRGKEEQKVPGDASRRTARAKRRLYSTSNSSNKQYLHTYLLFKRNIRNSKKTFKC